MKKIVRGLFFPPLHLSSLLPDPTPRRKCALAPSSRLRAAALLVQLDLVLEAVVQLKVVIL